MFGRYIRWAARDSTGGTAVASENEWILAGDDKVSGDSVDSVAASRVGSFKT